MIRPEEISFVVQGAVEPGITRRCLESIKRYFPRAEVILSTWEGSSVKGLPDHILVLNKDPGADYADQNRTVLYNINRMLLSSRNGLRLASRPYVLKCRSDMIFKNNHILNYWERYPKREPQLAVTQKKVIVGSLFSLKFEQGEEGRYETPFHISDFYCFGLREDIEKIYSVPLVDPKEFSRYFEFHKKPREYPVYGYRNRLWRYPPEQYITYSLAKEVLGEMKFDNCLEYENVDFRVNERFIVSNFIILDYGQSGIKSQKFPYNLWASLMFCPDRIWAGIYRNYVYLEDYRYYLDHELRLPQDKTGLKRKRYWIYHRSKPYLKPILKRIYKMME